MCVCGWERKEGVRSNRPRRRGLARSNRRACVWASRLAGWLANLSSALKTGAIIIGWPGCGGGI